MEFTDDLERLYGGYVHSEQENIITLAESLEFLISILSKIIEFPYQQKYKRFQADNPKVRKLIVDIHGSHHFIRRVCKFEIEKEDKNDGSEPKQYFVLRHNDISRLKLALSELKNLQDQMSYMLCTEVIKIVQMDSSSFYAAFFKTDTVEEVREFVARTRSDRNLVKANILKEFDPHGRLSPEKRKELVSEQMILQFTTLSLSKANKSELLEGEIQIEEAKLGGCMLRLTWPGDFGESMMEKTAEETSKKIEEEKKKRLDEINARIKEKEKAKTKRKKEKEAALAKFYADREKMKRR